MARKCTICEHEKVEEINRVLIGGASLSEIVSKYFGITKAALFRHKKNHLPAKLIKAQEIQEVAEADNLLTQVTLLRDKALSILNKAEQAGDLKTALQGIRETKGCLELLAKLQGELQERTEINILLNPQWVSLRTVILRTLEPYPEARLKLVQALKEAEDNAVN